MLGHDAHMPARPVPQMEYDKELLLRDIAEERREGRARVREGRGPKGSLARAGAGAGGAGRKHGISRAQSRDMSRDSLERKALRGPSVEMYRKRGEDARGAGVSVRGHPWERRRSISRDHGPNDCDAAAAPAARRGTARGGGGGFGVAGEEEGEGVMSWVVDAVDPEQFRMSLLENLVSKLRVRFALLSLRAAARMAAVSVAATSGIAARAATARRHWGWCALRQLRISSRQLGDLADLHISSLAAKLKHRALVCWRGLARFNNRLFLLAAAARVSHTRLLKSRALAQWKCWGAGQMLKRARGELARSWCWMSAGERVCQAWQELVRSQTTQRAALLRFAQGIGRGQPADSAGAGMLLREASGMPRAAGCIRRESAREQAALCCELHSRRHAAASALAAHGGAVLAVAALPRAPGVPEIPAASMPGGVREAHGAGVSVRSDGRTGVGRGRFGVGGLVRRRRKGGEAVGLGDGDGGALEVVRPGTRPCSPVDA